MCARKHFVALRDCNQKIVTPYFILQYINTSSITTMAEHECMVGFTVTKKLGNAVRRNRIKRRLREMVRLSFPAHASKGYAYVVIGRYTADKVPFATLMKDSANALARAHRHK
jgi:ribonuclease P protein component